VFFSARPPLAGSTRWINSYTCMKLRVGMPQDKIEVIFRAPPGDESTSGAPTARHIERASLTATCAAVSNATI